MASCCRRYRARRLKILGDDPQLRVLSPAPPPTSLYHLKPFKLSTALMAVHKDCYAPIGLIQQGGPRRRETHQQRDAVMHGSAAVDRPDTVFDGMLRIPGGTFRMGSDRHYPEEAPVHRVTVDEFYIDRTPVTNRQFKEFVRATGHVTFAEIPPAPKYYPGALPQMLYAGSLVFSPPARAVDLRDWSQWW